MTTRILLLALAVLLLAFGWRIETRAKLRQRMINRVLGVEPAHVPFPLGRALIGISFAVMMASHLGRAC